ncbi:hypothetical protein, partial [Cellulomonas sp.]|uniref:hypothetical protein n=1 Tax=Cellulomonas sp. TaxID=40001 RepID=UPI002D52EA8C
GEGGPTYAVARALGQEDDGGWRLVTARAFTALGAQQVTTVTCPTGAGIDVAQGQIAPGLFEWISPTGHRYLTRPGTGRSHDATADPHDEPPPF